ncbi:hypothetical protein APHAL10511_008413 [Amanita phalloides]|nr:hypothetical protein APHAL10511_008413 [Amanita phalloides]
MKDAGNTRSIHSKTSQSHTALHDHENDGNSRVRFTLQSLPKNTNIARFNALVVGRWIDWCTSQTGDPWDIPENAIQVAQQMWNLTLPDIQHMVKAVRLVNFILRQHFYEFCSQFADRAEKAVETFWITWDDLPTAEDKAEFVASILPQNIVKYDATRRKLVIPPVFFPWMWEDDGFDGLTDYSCYDPDKRPPASGPFQSEPLLNTFAHFLETVDHLHDHHRQLYHGKYPYGALALAAAAVEHAFSQWVIGVYQPLPWKAGAFSGRLWGWKTFEFVESLRRITDDNWADIYRKVDEYKHLYKVRDQSLYNAILNKTQPTPSGRALCFN